MGRCRFESSCQNKFLLVHLDQGFGDADDCNIKFCTRGNIRPMCLLQFYYKNEACVHCNE